jgi:hypothetical protein
MAALTPQWGVSAASTTARSLIRGIDALLRCKMGIFEFNSDRRCMFRASIGRVAAPFFVPESVAAPGAKMLVLHLRSERVPPLPAGGPDLMYAKYLTRMATDSFRMLAEYLLRDPQAADVAVIGGLTNIFFSGNIQAGKRIFSHLGMGITAHRSANGAVSRFFTNLYAWMMMWTYNPYVLRARRPLEIDWYAFWIGRDALVARFAPDAARERTS